MKTAQEFLTEFVKDVVAHPMERQQLIAGWAKHMEARERKIATSPTILNRLYGDAPIASPDGQVVK